jgi:hypothetical protein
MIQELLTFSDHSENVRASRQDFPAPARTTGLGILEFDSLAAQNSRPPIRTQGELCTDPFFSCCYGLQVR